MQNAHRIVEQGIGIDLPQFVAGIILQNVGQRFGVVAGRWKFGARQRVGNFLTQQRNIYRRAAVSCRGKQADEHSFADNVSRGIIFLYTDHIHVDPPVHGRTLIRLGQHQ